MTMEFSGVIFILLSFLQLYSCYEHYQNAIPNGDKVNHPCLPNYMWKGVGHYNQMGGGHRNPFGLDFASGGHKWTKELCQKDSDGDGKSNGDELGDPDCSWTPGTVPKRTTQITHPGVCEPVTTVTCQKRNAKFTGLCKSPEFQCNYTKSSDVSNMTIRFTKTTIPSKVTNYYCQSFEIPGNGTYHMIAAEALIDNAEVMHHALLFGCDVKPSQSTFEKASSCGMALHNCFNMIAAWTVGIAGSCLNEMYGIKVGATGYKYITLQFHWNNPRQKSGMTDASGLRLYLTKKLRPNNGAIMMVGQRYLELPPGQVLVAQNMTCSSDCTKSILKQEPHISITTATIHMHYSGQAGKLEHWRNGTRLRDLVPYQKIAYDNPEILEFHPPIVFKRGDELKLLCEYKTVTNSHTIYYGDGTQDEMCYAFLDYFPQLKNTYCLTYGPIEMCKAITVVGKCVYAQFNSFVLTLAPELDEFCDFSVQYCSPGCKEAVRKLIAHPCMQGWARKYLYFISTFQNNVLASALQKLRLQITPCEQVLQAEERTRTSTRAPILPGSTPFLNENTQLIILICACVGGTLLIITVVIIGLVKAFTQTGAPSTSKAKQYSKNDFDNLECKGGDSTHL